MPRREGERVLSFWDQEHAGNLGLVGITLVVSPGTVRSGVLTTSGLLGGPDTSPIFHF